MQQQLIELYSKLEKAFSKQHDKEKAKIFYEKFKDFSYDTMKSTIEAIIENEHRFPTIAKIMEYLKKVPVKSSKYENFIPCSKCKDTGWIEFEIDGYKFSGFCDCEVGKILHQEINESIQNSEYVSAADKIKITFVNEDTIEMTKRKIRKYALGYETNDEELEDAIPF